MRAASSLTGMLVSFLFPLCLTAAGATSQEAMAEYGVVYGMVMPVMLIPSAFLSSAALVLVPEFSECAARGEREKLAALTKKAVSRLSSSRGRSCPSMPIGADIGILLFDSPKKRRAHRARVFAAPPHERFHDRGEPSLLPPLRKAHPLHLPCGRGGDDRLRRLPCGEARERGAPLRHGGGTHALCRALLAVLKKKTGTAGEKKLLSKCSYLPASRSPSGLFSESSSCCI